MRATLADGSIERNLRQTQDVGACRWVGQLSPLVCGLGTLRRVKGPVHPWIDPTYAPIYIWRFPATVSDEEVIAAMEARERWAKSARHRCAWVVDLRELLRVPPHQRKLFADHLKRFEPHDIKYNCGSAIVLSNAWLRGIVTTMFAISPPKFPNRTFGTIEDGLKWAQEQMRADSAAEGGQ